MMRLIKTLFQGGYLPVVQDEEDNNKFKSIINTLGMKGAGWD